MGYMILLFFSARQKDIKNGSGKWSPCTNKMLLMHFAIVFNELELVESSTILHLIYIQLDARSFLSEQQCLSQICLIEFEFMLFENCTWFPMDLLQDVSYRWGNNGSGVLRFFSSLRETTMQLHLFKEKKNNAKTICFQKGSCPKLGLCATQLYPRSDTSS